MVTILGVGRAPTLKPRAPAAARSFRLPEQGAVPEPSIAAPIGLHGLLALQETAGAASSGPALAQDRVALVQAENLLSLLGGIQHAHLGGRQADGAQRMADVLGRMPSASNPELAGLLRAVRLRAEVEMARARL